MKEQADADKARADLLVTAASIVTGSILMATVASTSLRALAGQVALETVCNNNMNRTFSLMAVASSSQTFMFAMDKVLDTAKDKLKDQLTKTATDLTDSTKHMVVSSPLGQHLQLELFLVRHQRACLDAADIVATASVSDSIKENTYKALMKAPIIVPPLMALDSDQLSLRIELCFYMNKILDSDELDSFDSRTTIGGGPGPPPKVSPILQMPSARDYPKTTTPKMSGFTEGPWQAVTYDRPGSHIRRKIDEVHKQVFGRKFYEGEDWFGDVSKDMMATELRKAENVIVKLADTARPMGYSDNILRRS